MGGAVHVAQHPIRPISLTFKLPPGAENCFKVSKEVLITMAAWGAIPQATYASCCTLSRTIFAAEIQIMLARGCAASWVTILGCCHNLSCPHRPPNLTQVGV